jgi:hypothetical protein
MNPHADGNVATAFIAGLASAFQDPDKLPADGALLTRVSFSFCESRTPGPRSVCILMVTHSTQCPNCLASHVQAKTYARSHNLLDAFTGSVVGRQGLLGQCTASITTSVVH